MKVNKALALSQIFSLVLEIFAICFIMSASFALSAERVSGEIVRTGEADGVKYYINQDDEAYLDSSEQDYYGKAFGDRIFRHDSNKEPIACQPLTNIRLYSETPPPTGAPAPAAAPSSNDKDAFSVSEKEAEYVMGLTSPYWNEGGAESLAYLAEKNKNLRSQNLDLNKKINEIISSSASLNTKETRTWYYEGQIKKNEAQIDNNREIMAKKHLILNPGASEFDPFDSAPYLKIYNEAQQKKDAAAAGISLEKYQTELTNQKEIEYFDDALKIFRGTQFTGESDRGFIYYSENYAADQKEIDNLNTIINAGPDGPLWKKNSRGKPVDKGVYTEQKKDLEEHQKKMEDLYKKKYNSLDPSQKELVRDMTVSDTSELKRVSDSIIGQKTDLQARLKQEKKKGETKDKEEIQPDKTGTTPQPSPPASLPTDFSYKMGETTYKLQDGKWYETNSNGKLGKAVESGDTLTKLNKGAYEEFGSGYLSSKFFKAKPGGTFDTLASGVEWGALAFGGAKLLNQFIGTFAGGWNQDKQNAVTAAFTAGAFVYKTMDMLSNGQAGSLSRNYKSFLTNKDGGVWRQVASPIGLGLIAAYVAFAAFYKDTKTHSETIQFKCMLWQAPRGGSSCGSCNTDPLKPCSEYRCKALGQTCKLINAGTGMEKCIDSSPNDVTSPGIKPDKDALTQGYAYSEVKPRPAGSSGTGTSGMKITNSNSEAGCLKAFTPFTFGVITTDTGDKTQPAQCKIDYNHTASFSEMGYFMDDENKFTEKHEQIVSLPNTDTIKQSFPGVKNDGEYTLYIRCKDGNGNENKDEFAVRFCIDKTPDLSAPEIKATSLPSNSAVLYKIDKIDTGIYTNEPANCRWSRKDADYSNMENQMTCLNKIWEVNAESLYTCTTTLTGIKDKEENKFYFRCQDTSPQNNTMQQSYEYSLFGTQPLTILTVGPNGTIGSSTTTAIVNLTVKTDNGYKNGEATCDYSINNQDNYQPMFETANVNTHRQSLDLTEGDYTIYFKCFDAGGNTEYSQTSISVYVDKSAPIAVRTYNVESKIKVITNEASTCRYSTDSCNFDLSKDEGIDMLYSLTKEHWAEWKLGRAYYVKCLDEFNNQPEPTDCTIVLRPFELPQKA